ncbi:hypothetical protein O9929_05690 [Vibrio lentus]|nr:hypothetical protein [Vibrio lentus]
MSIIGSHIDEALQEAIRENLDFMPAFAHRLVDDLQLDRKSATLSTRQPTFAALMVTHRELKLIRRL